MELELDLHLDIGMRWDSLLVPLLPFLLRCVAAIFKFNLIHFVR